MEKRFYFEKLYPFQDEILQSLNRLRTGFYLTEGTALSRAYLHHRFSDDLDLFVNDEGSFSLWAGEAIQATQAVPKCRIQVLQREERFVRLMLVREDVSLRMEMVNDVPAHVGDITIHPILGRLDSPENILANKITAIIDRNEPKDLADIWGLCIKMSLSLRAAIESASSKAAGIFPADIARVLCTATTGHWQVVQWIDPPPVDRFLDDLRRLGEGLIL